MRTKNLDKDTKKDVDNYLNEKPKTSKGRISLADERGNACAEFKKMYSVSKFKSKTANQKRIIESIKNPEVIISVASGKPGTGKTYSAIQGALEEFKSGNYDKIYLCKSVKTLDSGSEEVGFLKGTLEEKIAPFIFSFDFNFTQIIDEEVYLSAKENKIIEFLPIAYIRGIGIKNSIIIVDEAQNINTSILRTILSRIGMNTKIILLGDTQQKDSDTKNDCGLTFLIKHFQDIKGIEFINMTKDDQSRSPLINIIEDKYDELEDKGILKKK